MNARTLFDQLMAGGHAAVCALIDESPAETPYYDFKEKGRPGKGEENEPRHALMKADRGNYAKSLSGFGNAGGGVIIWGIGEKGKGETRKLHARPLPNVNGFCETLYRALPQAVVPLIEGVLNEPIYVDDDETGDSGYILTWVPQSDRMLHRAEFHLKQYYRRIGDSMICLDHHSIEDAFGLRLRPQMDVENISFAQHRISPSVLYNLQLTLTNEGRAIAQHFGVDLEFPADLRPQTPRLDGVMAMPGEPASAFIEEGNAVWLVKLRKPATAPPVYPGETVQILSSPYADHYVRDRMTEEFVREFHLSTVRYRVYCENARMVQGSVPFASLYDSTRFGT